MTSDRLADTFGVVFLVGAGGLGLVALGAALITIRECVQDKDWGLASAKVFTLVALLGLAGVIAVAVYWAGTGRLK
jgi:hypothetical protein